MVHLGIFSVFSGSCSHGRSYEYYAETLTNGGFSASACSSIVTYNLGLCRGSENALMGDDAVDRR